MVGSFNFGFLQSMISGSSKEKYCAEFARVCAKIVEEGNCDLLFACEVGGFRQGFLNANINVNDVLVKPLGRNMRLLEEDNYIALWGFRGASQPTKVSLNGNAKHTESHWQRETWTL